MKVIMYHYVRPFNCDEPYWRALLVDDFIRQLDYFEKKFGFISKEDFILSMQKKRAVKGIVLTFDDGFSDHYKYVFPELIKRKIWGIFYIPTLPYMGNKILDVHRIHLLLGRYGGKRIADSLNNLVNTNMLSYSHISEFHTFQSYKKNYDNDTDYVKRLLNYFISYKYKTKIIDQLMSIYYPNSEHLCKYFYMKRNEIKEMYKAGMVFGSHTVNHPVMSKLSLEMQKYEVDESFKIVDSIVPTSELKTFCYPYGGFHSFTNETEKLLISANCDFSFNVESKNVNNKYLKDRIQALPRFNCNEFPYGSCR
jgi:peptidoglycan/xylan/chitin deacetylase (PgdA/CDA1 family)